MPTHSYIFEPTREMWPGGSVDARLPAVVLTDSEGRPLLDEDGDPQTLRASAWLDVNRSVEQMTWAPGLPTLIRDRLISGGGWIERPSVTTFNLYRPAIIKPGDPTRAKPWRDHLKKVHGEDADHIEKFLAHRVQRPEEKINHALVLGGNQGIGKDTSLEPVKHAVGPWNFAEVGPRTILNSDFTGFLRSVILRVSEVRDLGEADRFTFYDHMKAYTASPPDVLRINEKNLREYYVPNCCGVVYTTNRKTDGIYLPADDRRHFVAWSNLQKEDFSESYWNELWGWYRNGGFADVAAYLAQLNISDFDPKAPPPKTAAFWEIVNANRTPEDAALADALDELKRPDVVTLARLTFVARGELLDWLLDRRHRRAVPHRLEQCGYVPVRNDTANDGLWKLGGKRQVIYARSELSLRERHAAATALVAELAIEAADD